jgi:hemoglobin-like flavoprotein
MDIEQSVQLILRAKDTLGRLFYEHLLERYPELRHHFDKVDLQRQGVLLTTALMVIQRYCDDPTPALELYLKYLGTRHHELGVAKEDYSKWTKAMLETMQRFHGSQWTPDLETHWRKAFGKATKLMFEGYGRAYTI